VLRDVIDERLTIEAAAAQYGVVITAPHGSADAKALEVDEAKTASLRKNRRRAA
jgi:hypothetical protein